MTNSESQTPANNSPIYGKFAGIILLSTGMLIVAFAVTAWWLMSTSQTELMSLNVEYENPPINVQTIPTSVPTDNLKSQMIEKESIKAPALPAPSEESVTMVNSEPTLGNQGSEIENETESFATLLDGYGNDSFLKNIAPKSWSDHDWLLPDQFSEQADNFNYFDLELLEKTDITVDLISGLPEKISIPILDLEAPVENLRIVEKEGLQVYETPKNLVGRIPSSPEESDTFKGWYFGHLESPIKGEGNVFHNLPEIAEHLIEGNKVLISLEKSGKHLVYQAILSEVVHESKLKLYDPGNERIVLVTCSNRPLYDHRQLVTATLVGQIK